ncbi:MAG: discoidin domain-containing protein [Candidatus Sulfopaludibacter sp.]|nr:discoidin domain-containing protein [Candidatus Sulfopaludibacter sp.]
MRQSALLLFPFLLALQAQQYTRGVGVYPGDPKQDFAPALVPDAQAYRNLALHRAAYQSSSYDFYQTAQLVTDGIKETTLPRWFSISTSDRGTLSRQEREHAVDHNTTTRVNVSGASPWIQVETGGGDAPFEIDRIDVIAGGRGSTGGTLVVTGSEDGKAWREWGRVTPPSPPTPAAGGRGFGFFAPPVPATVAFSAPARTRFYRLAYEGGTGTQWSVSELAFYRNNERVEIGGPYHFTSAWKPAGSGEEWVYVDLGAACTFDRVVLNWIRRAAEGAVQASDDAKTWRTLQALPPAAGAVDDLKLASPARARYVRVLVTKPAMPEGYILSELEVYGRGGPIATPHAAATPDANGRLALSGGAWRIQRDSLVTADGASLSRPGFVDKDWVVATVPATVLSSYWNAGALPDPNYGDNINAISDSFFYADFWYRCEFTAPPLAAGRRAWLHFRGIDWKAALYLNGEPLGEIDGGFIRGLFDVTKIIKPGARNAIAIRIRKNATPGSVKEKTWESPDPNGGALGADNPTYHATAGWDWIPSVRGRDIGIWSDIYLDNSGPVTIDNPFVSTTLPLPDTSRAGISVQATLHNHGGAAVTGTLHGRFGDIAFDLPVTLEAGQLKLVEHRLQLGNPKLWWPAGYGAQNLYKVQLTFATSDQKTSDAKSFRTGVRQFTYSDENTAIKIFINGRRFVGRGGNWGFPEVNLRYRAREYDAAVRYHKDMNFTMIRNWVGQTGDDEFFDACDKYGIVVWQDFWLANPVDGPNPNDPEMFLENSEDFIRRIRNHPSIGIYCGRNEGNPPQPINDGLKAQVANLHPGLQYIPNSAQGPVSGGGPYRTVPPKQYFQTRATTKLHSELGMPNIVTFDSLKQMMPEKDMWPQGDVWGIHDFTRTGAQGGTAWLDMIERNYGGAANAADWVELSQFINYDGYRAIFEAQSKNRMGVLLWMSHPCWPSFVWQTYDYYFDTSAGYFGSKKGSEPLHIQWNPLSDTVEVVNYSAGNVQGLSAHVEVRNMNGALQWEKSATLDSKEDSVEAPIKIEFPAGLSPVHFIRLKLTRGGQTVSDNFYLRGLEETALGYNLKAIRTLPKVRVEAASKVVQQGTRWLITTELHNAGGQPALMVRVKPVREKSGDRILPAISSDNYVALMPGERRTIRTELENADTRGERPRIVVEGFNVQ